MTCSVCFNRADRKKKRVLKCPMTQRAYVGCRTQSPLPGLVTHSLQNGEEGELADATEASCSRCGIDQVVSVAHSRSLFVKWRRLGVARLPFSGFKCGTDLR